ncbi:hypothetical protein K0M31_001667 [Melipona bicolor]|uniref:Uncharacterized protein n=1 Tax=Melipona bicolor TaxID=60889 RepID=A0AA40GG16_9HYME|nr:hypothetical protein K0M31_001667 [Melipona bicolor]
MWQEHDESGAKMRRAPWNPVEGEEIRFDEETKTKSFSGRGHPVDGAFARCTSSESGYFVSVATVSRLTEKRNAAG